MMRLCIKKLTCYVSEELRSYAKVSEVLPLAFLAFLNVAVSMEFKEGCVCVCVC